MAQLTLSALRAACAGALALVVVAAADGADASHISGTELQHMHNANIEDFCVMVEDGSMGLYSAAVRIRATLYYDNPAEDWDGLANNKVFFSLVTPYTPCNQLTDRSSIQIEYWLRSSGCGGVSCAWLTTWQAGHGGHNDYLYGYVRFKTSHISGNSSLYHHVVNHETGHLLGLKDPNYTGHCDDSVMHSRYYGCNADREWPSGADRTRVTNIANYAE